MNFDLSQQSQVDGASDSDARKIATSIDEKFKLGTCRYEVGSGFTQGCMDMQQAVYDQSAALDNLFNKELSTLGNMEFPGYVTFDDMLPTIKNNYTGQITPEVEKAFAELKSTYGGDISHFETHNKLVAKF